jgi:hypothetical protein
VDLIGATYAERRFAAAPEAPVPEPAEGASQCFDCRRTVPYDVDACLFCGSIAMVTEQTIARVHAQRAGRKPAKPRR